MDREDLGRRIYETAHLTGRFLLRSGATSEEYFDKYLFESDPVLLRAIAEAMAPLVPSSTDALAGLELGGVPLATALSRETGLATRFVRKEAKAYGTCRLAEGGDVDGERLVVVEDVVTSGGQVVMSCADLRVEVVERLLGHHRRHLGADAEADVVLVHHEEPPGLGHRGQDRLAVERGDRAQVDHLDRRAVTCAEGVSRLEREVAVEPVGDHREVVAATRDVGHAERNPPVAAGHRALAEPVALLALAEQDRIRVVD